SAYAFGLLDTTTATRPRISPRAHALRIACRFVPWPDTRTPMRTGARGPPRPLCGLGAERGIAGTGRDSVGLSGTDVAFPRSRVPLFPLVIAAPRRARPSRSPQ